MAVSADGLHVRPPAARHFVRLKLRMIRNGMRGRRSRVVLFVIGLLVGLWAAFAGFAGFAAASTSSDPELAVTTAGLVGAGITLAWVLVPLLFFGVDETIDPARFALLPVRRRTLAVGMLAAACVGVPAVATLLAGLGLVVGGVGAGVGGVVVAVLAAGIGLVLCVVASRAVTSAFASMLRSRRMRDLAVLVFVLLAASIGPLQVTISSAVRNDGIGQVAGVARVLAWTPLSAHYVAVLDARDGHWGLAVARLGIGLAAILLLLWWWSFTLEGAMLGNTSAGPAAASSSGVGIVASLVPALLRRLPLGRTTAIMSRDLRYYWREPRMRSGMASLLITSIFLPVMLLVLPGGRQFGASSVIVAVFVGSVTGVSMANLFGNDGLAFASQVLIGVPGRIELRARVAALSMVVLPLLLVVNIAAPILGGRPGQVPGTVGVGLAAFGVSVSTALIAAVWVPYPMPQSGNPFAVSSGGATVRGMSGMLVMGVAMGATTPVILLFVLLPAALTWLTLLVGTAWGLGAVLIGTYILGDAVDRRGPEILADVSPRI